MSELEMFFPIPESKYGDGILVEEYGGRISLVAAQEGRDGNQYKRWCYPQGKDRGPMDKAVPWKIGIGTDRESSIRMLKSIISFLSPGKGEPYDEPPTPEEDDIPF